jgi:signal transduction histidine kinase
MTQLTPDSIQSFLELEGKEHSLSSSIEHHLLRIAQEAIANAVKHADARRITIRLVYDVHAVILSVNDDGRGFDTRAVLEARSEHFGLRSLRSRAAKINGTLRIESSPQAGTSIIAQVPLADL